jgi:nucleotide-binding universal stress UspA family protein
MLPPRSILTAVDFSESSRVALIFAARLATHCRSALHILHAEDPLLVAAAAKKHVDLPADTRDELQRFIDTAPPAAVLSPRLDVVTGSPVPVILDVARREGADLIVLGAHGMSGAERVLFGSVAEGVLLEAERSILLVPSTWRAPFPDGSDLQGIGPIVVGIDVSDPSITAAEAACALAERLATWVEALHIVPTLPVPQRWRSHADRVVDERIEVARRELARQMGALKTPVRITTRVERGRVEEELAAGAGDIGSRHPLLLLGRRSSRSRGSSPGATAYRVASLARVPVLMHEP